MQGTPHTQAAGGRSTTRFPASMSIEILEHVQGSGVTVTY